MKGNKWNRKVMKRKRDKKKQQNKKVGKKRNKYI